MSVTVQDVIDTAVNDLGWTASPTTDLTIAVRQKYRITDRRANALVSKVLGMDVIKQVTKEEWERLNPSSMTTGMLSVPSTKWRWIENENSIS